MITETYSIIAVGGQEFTLGFRLAGVKTIETDKPTEPFEKLLAEKEMSTSEIKIY